MVDPQTPSPAGPPGIPQPNARRTLVLAALGALAGLIIAGFGLFTAKGTSTLIVPPEDVALVNQQPVSRVDYLAVLQSTYATTLQDATPEQRHKILEDMIREELLVQRGKELDVALTDADVRTAMVAAVEQQAAMNAYTEQPSDAKLQAYYEAHRNTYASEGMIAVRDLLFNDAATAKGAATSLKSGQTAEAVAKTLSGREPRKVEGEEFYFAAKIHLGDTLFATVQALPSGGISDVVQADGFHVLIVTKNAPPVPYTFESARAKVLQDYRNDAAQRLQAGSSEFLRKRANVLIAKDMK